jgi:PTH1 family peptidyl-tRNA hydrolase
MLKIVGLTPTGFCGHRQVSNRKWEKWKGVPFLSLEWIIVGLGNPGEEYCRHRHNLGFMAVDALAEKQRSSWRSNRRKAMTCEVRIAGRDALLVKPQTYMNLSGAAVAPILTARRVIPEKMIVVHDDLDLTEGRVRIKVGGGHGGHRGLGSIIDCLERADFVRVRLGIGRPPAGVPPREFVLTSFGPEGADVMKDLIQGGLSAVRLILTHGVERAQNALHSKT